MGECYKVGCDLWVGYYALSSKGRDNITINFEESSIKGERNVIRVSFIEGAPAGIIGGVTGVSLFRPRRLPREREKD